MLASKVTETPLEAQMGRVHGSKRTKTYVHLSGRDQDNAILKAYGIELNEEYPIETDRPNHCPICNEPNGKNARFCWNCGMILDKKLIERKLTDGVNLIENSVLDSKVVDYSTKNSLNLSRLNSKI